MVPLKARTIFPVLPTYPETAFGGEFDEPPADLSRPFWQS